MNFLENITFRRTRTQSDSKDRSCIVSPLDDTVSSLPDLSTEDSSDLLNKYKEQIDELTTQLNSAHTEIESLSLENNKLRKLNNELVKKNDLYKKITDSPIKKPKLNTPMKKSKITNASTKQTQTDHLTEKYKKNNQKRDKSSNRCKQTERPKKICLLSTNKNNKILEIAENTFQGCLLCHYLYPNCDIKQLLTNIEKKLAGYTMDDYCVVMIGESDFKVTKDYFSLIYYIRDILQQIKYTNIIICLPTYKYGYLQNMFNWRVETFNNLLYLDVMTHEHAYLLDTNKKLNYDFYMFNKQLGFINNNGMKTIFHNLKELISEIDKYYTSEELSNNYQVTPKEIESLFFRD